MIDRMTDRQTEWAADVGKQDGTDNERQQ